MREIKATTQFNKDHKKIIKSGKFKKKDVLDVIEMLANDKPLASKYRDHWLIGEWKGFKECHIKPDLLLIYQKHDKYLILARLGSHSELF